MQKVVNGGALGVNRRIAWRSRLTCVFVTSERIRNGTVERSLTRVEKSAPRCLGMANGAYTRAHFYAIRGRVLRALLKQIEGVRAVKNHK